MTDKRLAELKAWVATTGSNNNATRTIRELLDALTVEREDRDAARKVAAHCRDGWQDQQAMYDSAAFLIFLWETE
jgi:hypothetical protein